MTKKTEKEWIPAFAGMTKKRKTGKKKNKKNFMLFMYFMVIFRVAVNGYEKTWTRWLCYVPFSQPCSISARSSSGMSKFE